MRFSFPPIGLILVAALWWAAPAAGACTGATCGAVALPYALNFSGDRGGLDDRNGVGTGFTIVDQPSHGTGYLPHLLHVDTAAGKLGIQTTAGIAYRGVNSLDNALGIGVTPRGNAFSLRTTLIEIPAAHGSYAQAGLWFGASEDDYVKLVVIATPSGTRVQMLRESGGVPKAYNDPLPITAASAAVSLRLRVDPTGGQVTGAYAVNGGPARQIRTLPVTPALLYRGYVGTEQAATGGIFATHRNNAQALLYAFDSFEAACVTSPCTAVPPPDPDFGDGDPPVGEPVEGEEPGGGTGGNPVPPPPAAPPTGGDDAGPNTPGATLQLRRSVRLSALRRRGLRAALRCSAQCTFTARLKLSDRSARRLRALSAPNASVVVARARGAARADRSTRFAVRPSKRTGRRLAATGLRTLRAKLRVRVSFGSDGTRTIRRTVLVRAPARVDG